MKSLAQPPLGVLGPGAIPHNGNAQKGLFGDIGRGFKDVFGRLIRFSSSPYGLGFAASLSHGDGLGEAALAGDQYTLRQQQMDYLKQQKEDELRRQMVNDAYTHDYQAARIKKMNTPPPRAIIKGADGFQYYQDTGARVLPNVSIQPQAPHLETLYGNNGQQYKGKWNPSTKSYDRIGGFKPTTNTVTPAQTAGNKEIQDARDYISGIKVPEGSTLMEEVTRRTQKTSNTGRINKDYSPLLARYLSKATNRMVGKDGGYAAFMQTLAGGTPSGASPHVQPEMKDQIITEARSAIEQGADREKVLARLKEMGVDTTGL